MSNMPPPTGPDEIGRPGQPPVDGGPFSPTWMMTEAAPPGWQPKQKMTAGILGILLNGLGIHSFYLGNTKKGIIQLVVSIVTCGLGGIWGLVEGIQILTGSISTDAYGIPLTE
jgi:hypothetical protein